MRGAIVYTLVLLMVISPIQPLLYTMPVPSASRAPQPLPQERAGGYYYYHYEYDPLFLFFESILYIGLVVGTLLILDEHLDNVTIIIYD